MEDDLLWVEGLSIKELKKELDIRNINYSDCFEKTDLKSKLKTALMDPKINKNPSTNSRGTIREKMIQ
jgi:hypothetical protein